VRRRLVGRGDADESLVICRAPGYPSARPALRTAGTTLAALGDLVDTRTRRESALAILAGLDKPQAAELRDTIGQPDLVVRP
jgi:hypothetical protein